MSFFNWLSGKSGKSTPPSVASEKDGAPLVHDAQARPRSLRDKTTALPAERLVVDSSNRSEERKLKRHARREQLYQAVRESLTHAGVLSATYQFKVLSLDQSGNEFMVMMDVDQSFDHRAEKLADIAAKIVQTAKIYYEIRVASVYWRVRVFAAPSADKAATPKVTQPIPAQSHDAVTPAPRKTPDFRYDPIQEDEVAAFKQALVTASVTSPAATDTSAKARNHSRSYTLLTGFEDTEMPESANVPALSATQYGELN